METQMSQLWNHEADVAQRYAPLVAEALDCKVDAMRPFDLLIIAGFVIDDKEFSKRYSAAQSAWLDAQVAKYGDGFLTSSARFKLEEREQLDVQVAAAMTREEKLALRGRVCAKAGLKLT